MIGFVNFVISTFKLIFVGYKYVFQPNLNRATCSLIRYQPFIFDTIGRSDCTFLKSFCNSEGQMTFKDGTTNSDRTCICNINEGYTFLTEPINQCSCNISNEDCSCYIATNHNNRTIDPEGKVIIFFIDFHTVHIKNIQDSFNIRFYIQYCVLVYGTMITVLLFSLLNNKFRFYFKNCMLLFVFES